MDPNTPPVSPLISQPASQPTVTLQAKKPFWESIPFIIVLLLLVWPVGLIFLWLYLPWKKLIKIAVTVLVLLIYLVPTILFFYYMVLIATHQPLPYPAAQSVIQNKNLNQ